MIFPRALLTGSTLAIALLATAGPASAASSFADPFDVIVHPKPVPNDADLLEACIHLNVTLSRVAPVLKTPTGPYETSTVVGIIPAIPHDGLRHACVSEFYGVKPGAKYFVIFDKGALSHPFRPLGGWFNPFAYRAHERPNPVTKHPYREIEIDL